MSAYENRPVPEGINVSPSHPLKEFALLLGGVSALLVGAVLVLSLLAGYLVRFVPFAQEQALAASLEDRWRQQKPAVATPAEQYLQALAGRLAAAMDMPPEMPITVHHVAGDTVNAMATLGGHIIVFQGLIDALPNENALAMVLAHEIAHVRHRHPIVAMGRGFTVALALSSLAGIGDGLMQQWFGSLGMLPILSFSRSQEAAADADALRAVHQVYGHVGSAAALFEQLAQHSTLPDPPALFSTHPGHGERIERIRRYEREHPGGPDNVLTPIPAGLKSQH